MASLGEDLLVTVNKLQDLVFNTIGNDSLDLPQIVSVAPPVPSAHSVSNEILTYSRLSSAPNPPASHRSSRTLSGEISSRAEAASSLDAH